MDFTPSQLVGSVAPLVGRDRDLDHIRVLMAREPGTGALLLSGQPGIGKSAVLEAAAVATAAAGVRVLRAAGVEFEADISYAALNQVVLPLRDALGDLSPHHREALGVALGLGAGAAPERLVVCNAALALLRSVAVEAPVLLIVDDLPWVDRASAAVFGFIARRLTGERVRFLGATRTGAGSFFEHTGLPTYELPALDPESAARLVDTRFPQLALPVRRRLLDTAEGNPLALLELPKALREEQRRAQEILPVVLPLGERLQSLFLTRVRDLPAGARDLLLLAALDGTGELGVLAAAARELDADVDLDDLGPAENDQLVRVDEGTRRLVFRHPLVRAAVVEDATSSRRRAAHGALARVLDDRPVQRAWHLGEATVRPDEDVAAQLEHAARRILERGDAVAAISALTRAAGLSPLGADRARRLAEAAYWGAEAVGALSSASTLLDDVWQADPDHGVSLHSAGAAVQLLLNSDGDVATAHRLLVGAIEEGSHGYDADDPALIDTLHFLMLLCSYSGNKELWAPYHTALSRLRPTAPPLLHIGARTFSDPVRTDAAALRQLDAIIDGVTSDADLADIVRIGTAAIYADRLSELRQASWRVVRRGREGGPVRRHIGSLLHLCLDDYLCGRWQEALELSDEGLARCADSGYTICTWFFQFTKGLVVASQGDAEQAHDLADTMTEWAVPRGMRMTVDCARQVHILADVAAGEFDRAFGRADAVSPAGSLQPHAPHALWVFFDLVESAVRTDRRAEAAAHVRALRQANVARLSPRLALLVAGAEALVAEDDRDAACLFAQAVAQPGVEKWPFDLARIRLAQGEQLRRARAVTEAKAPLTAALRAFQRLDAAPWAERARKELRAAGGHVAARGACSAAVLTPQEREIAELAATGLTNKQIAERLFISHRTVGAHLYQIYPKLGITSRIALRDALLAQGMNEPSA